MDGGSTGLIAIACDARGYVVDARKLRSLARSVMRVLGVAEYELAVTLTGSARIKELNRQFRGKNKATDVLSFPQSVFPKPLTPEKPLKRRSRGVRLLGDVVISLPQAKLNARHIGHDLDREVCFLLVHGILHLCGHDHENPDDEAVMLSAQRALIDRLGRGRNGPRWAGGVR